MGKRKIRFNFLDVLLILGVLALVAGIIWRQELTDRMQIRDSENTLGVVCEFELVTREEEGGLYKRVQFSEGSTAIYMNNSAVGNVEKTTLYASPETSGEENGSEDAGVAIEKTLLNLRAVSKDSGYYVAGEVKLYIGGVYRFHTKTEEFSVRITSIEDQ